MKCIVPSCSASTAVRPAGQHVTRGALPEETQTCPAHWDSCFVCGSPLGKCGAHNEEDAAAVSVRLRGHVLRAPVLRLIRGGKP